MRFAFAAAQSKGLEQPLALVVFHSEPHECKPPVKASGNPSTCIFSFGLSHSTLDVPEGQTQSVQMKERINPMKNASCDSRNAYTTVNLKVKSLGVKFKTKIKTKRSVHFKKFI